MPILCRASRDEEVAQCEAKCAALEQQLAQRMAAVEGIAAREKADIIAGGTGCFCANACIQPAQPLACRRTCLGAVQSRCTASTTSTLRLAQDRCGRCCAFLSTALNPKLCAGYEKQISAAVAAEREARQAAAQARQDGELAASRLAHAEARVVEQELAMQRMVSQVCWGLGQLELAGCATVAVPQPVRGGSIGLHRAAAPPTGVVREVGRVPDSCPQHYPGILF